MNDDKLKNKLKKLKIQYLIIHVGKCLKIQGRGINVKKMFGWEELKFWQNLFFDLKKTQKCKKTSR
jgi:hypothetical protein